MLRFRAPGSRLSAASLVGRVLGIEASAAARRVRGGALAFSGVGGKIRERVREPEAPVAPGTALLLDAAPPVAPVGEKGWQAITPSLPWPSAQPEGFAYETLEDHAGLARLELRLGTASLDSVRAWLAGAGAPVLGDLLHGGVAVAGGLHLAASSDGAEPLDWPDEPVFPPETPAPEATLQISAGTARALSRGHPWVIADRETERGDRFAAGTRVRLVDAHGREHGSARVEASRDLAARVWSRDNPTERSRKARATHVAFSLEARVAAALRRRRALLAAKDTDAIRLVHGEADNLPGLAVDRLGPVLRILVTGRAALPLRARVRAALLAARLPGLPADPPVVEVMHLRDRPPGALVCVRLVSGEASALEAPLIVREGVLRFRVEVGLAEPARPRPGVGFFLDQRDNRARLAARAASGGRFLNLFAHTGGFSAALLAGGADEVVSVDLSAPYLAQLSENLERSGLALDRHRGVRREARRFLAELDPAERFRGIVIDPPIAAAAGRRFWNVRRDLGPLVAAALARLQPGGFLLVTRQDRAGRAGLEALLRAESERTKLPIAHLERAPAGEDFPALAGFPEGAPFEAFLATRA